MAPSAHLQFSASDTYLLHRPSRCERRVFLSAQPTERAQSGPFERLLEALGVRHEKRHLESFERIVDLSMVARVNRVAQTQTAIEDRAPAIYQPAFAAEMRVDGHSVHVVGVPDFLIRQGDGYVIRDAKLAGNVAGRREIEDQMAIYGALYESAVREAPASLQILTGRNEIQSFDYAGWPRAHAIIREILKLRLAPVEPDSPVGSSKCSGCPFKQHCWTRAEAARDVALVPEVDQGLAIALRASGVASFDQLVDRFDETSLSELSRPWGTRTQKVGNKAALVLAQARALSEQREIWLACPTIPSSRNFVMFDLEGIPPYAEDTGRIYLWGTRVYGQDPGPFQPAPRGTEMLDDEQTWAEFLGVAQSIFDAYGDIPFVHWSAYERTQLRTYIERYGDRDGVASRVLENLLDLLPITKNCVALPCSSFSLKVVEKHVGFRRSQDEYGGDWSIAKFIEATELEDADARAGLLQEIWRYNEEDLGATWAVLEWLRRAAETPAA